MVRQIKDYKLDSTANNIGISKCDLCGEDKFGRDYHTVLGEEHNEHGHLFICDECARSNAYNVPYELKDYEINKIIGIDVIKVILQDKIGYYFPCGCGG